MKSVLHLLKMILPVALVIFILGAKPSKARGQDSDKKEKTTYAIKVVKDEDGKKVVFDTTFTWTDDEGIEHKVLDMDLDLEDCEEGTIVMKVKESDDGHAYVYCISESETDGKAKAIASAICSEEDGVVTIKTDEDGEIKLMVKTKKSDGESEADIYIIKAKSKDKKEKNK